MLEQLKGIFPEDLSARIHWIDELTATLKVPSGELFLVHYVENKYFANGTDYNFGHWKLALVASEIKGEFDLGVTCHAIGKFDILSTDLRKEEQCGV